MVPIRGPPRQTQSSTVAQKPLGTQIRNSGEETSHSGSSQALPGKAQRPRGSYRADKICAQLLEGCMYVLEGMYIHSHRWTSVLLSKRRSRMRPLVLSVSLCVPCPPLLHHCRARGEVAEHPPDAASRAAARARHSILPHCRI